MATNAGRFNTVSLTSDAALAQYRLVTLDPAVTTTDGSAAYPNAQGQHALGITMTSADAAGKIVAVQYDGIALAEAGGAIAAGDLGASVSSRPQRGVVSLVERLCQARYRRLLGQRHQPGRWPAGDRHRRGGVLAVAAQHGLHVCERHRGGAVGAGRQAWLQPAGH